MYIGGRNLLKNSNNPAAWTKYDEASATITTVDMTDEWGPEAQNARRVITTGGMDTVKIFQKALNYSEKGQSYMLSAWIKNTGSNRLIVNSNTGYAKEVGPGYSGRIVFDAMGSGSSHLQFQIRTIDVSDSLEFIIWRAKVELGNYATDWMPYVGTEDLA